MMKKLFIMLLFSLSLSIFAQSEYQKEETKTQTATSNKKSNWYQVRDYITAWEHKNSFKIKYSPKILDIMDLASKVIGIEIISVSIMVDKAMMDTAANAEGKIDSFGYNYLENSNPSTPNYTELRGELAKTLKDAFYQIYSDGINEDKEVGLVVFSKKKAVAYYENID